MPRIVTSADASPQRKASSRARCTGSSRLVRAAEEDLRSAGVAIGRRADLRGGRCCVKTRARCVKRSPILPSTRFSRSSAIPELLLALTASPKLPATHTSPTCPPPPPTASGFIGGRHDGVGADGRLGEGARGAFLLLDRRLEPYTPMREKHLKNGFAATTSNAEVVQRSDTIVLVDQARRDPGGAGGARRGGTGSSSSRSPPACRCARSRGCCRRARASCA